MPCLHNLSTNFWVVKKADELESGGCGEIGIEDRVEVDTSWGG